MIIVYYDSAVQMTFEDLVKLVSGSRNAMWKGKMAAKMAASTTWRLQYRDRKHQTETEEVKQSAKRR